jgi:basic membrane protein A and related proteins
MKKITTVLVLLMLVSITFYGCADKTTTNISSLKVGLSTDEGGLNDKSFNQAADEGVKKGKAEFGIEYSAIESKTKDDYEPNLQALIDNGAGLIFGVGFQMEAAVTKIAKVNPKTKITIIDDVIALPNVESIVFKAEEGSFLVGVIAGKMTKTGKVGFIGGKDMSLINAFEYGFYAGVKSVNPEAAVNLLNRKYTVYADSFADTNKGNEAAKQLYGKGCDIIYHAAGGVGIGLFQAAKVLKSKGENVWAIGVDMDQAVILPEFKSVILTSAMKRVDIGTYSAVKDYVNSNFKAGKTVVLGLKEGGVGIAPSSNKNVPASILKIVDKYSNLIKTGVIVVPTDKNMATKFKVVNIE